MVVAFHAGLPLPGGFVGVDVFFVISGFVITAMLMREWADTGRVRLGRFYVRRFKRLTPALALTVGVVMVASALLLSPFGDQQTAAKTGIGAMLLAANVVIARTTGDYFDAPAEANPLLHTWSLSVEEQFYLVFPALLLAAWVLGKRARHPMGAAVVVGLVGATSFALALAGSAGLQVPLLPDSLLGFYGPATRAWEFAAGALLALGGARVALARRRMALPVALAGGALLIASLWLITAMTPFPGAWTLLPVIGTTLIIAAGGIDGVITRGLSSRPMVAIGDRSYSIYLWHWPFIVFAQLLWPDSPPILLVAAALSFLPAYASYRWVEQPIRGLPPAGGIPLARLVAAVVIPPLALAGALGLVSHNGYWSPSVQAYQAAIQAPHAGAAAGCTEQAWRHPTRCTWNADATGVPIYLVGDSNADQFSEALVGGAQSLSRPLTGLSEDGCSFLPASLALDDDAENNRCQQYTAQAESFLRTAQPGLVVIANSNLWFRGSRREAIGRPGDPPSQDPETKLDALSSGLDQAVRSLQDTGHSVLLVQPIPHWGDQKESLNWAACSALDMITVGCAATMEMQDVLGRQRAAADVLAAVARETGADVLDVSTELCSEGTCSSVTPEGLVRYRDGTHITVEQSEALAGTFTKAIAAAG
jgi:peptidoglycan/LPS O-acetylase OafA/YrhL